jgi:penicillin-binding protein 2
LGVDLPGEKRGLIPNSQYYGNAYRDKTGKSWWNAITIISIAIGQGEIQLSPLQICNLSATIANRGYYHTPHIVKEIKGVPLDSTFTETHYTGIERQHYETVAAGMRAAVTGGTCSRVSIPDIEVCAKTGTAQNSGKDHSIFMAFAPKDDPQVAIVVLVENGGFGASNALPIAKLMIQKAIKGEIPESDKWLEASIKNTTILRSVISKN